MLVEIAVSIVTLLFLLSLYKFVTRPSNLPPGPIPLPIIGNVLSIVGQDLHLLASKLAKTYGDVVTLDVFGERIVFVNSATAAREALLGKNTNLLAGRPHQFTFSFVSRECKDIIFCDFSPALIWRRKIAHSGLRMYMRSSLEGHVIKEVTRLEKKLRKSTAPVDSRDECTLLVLNIICAILCGKSYEINDPEFTKIVELISTAAKLPLAGSMLDVFPWLIHFPLKDSITFKTVRDIRDEVLDKLFREHKETFTEDNIRDLTDAFLKAKIDVEREDKTAVGEVTDDHVTMLMDDVLGAGTETTATSLRWSIAYLIHYPQLQARAQVEIDDVIGDRWPSFSDRQHLPYLEALIAEVLRISAVAPLGIPHKATADATLQGYTIPKGTTLIINLWAILNDPKEWENPDEFNPSRFINADGKFEVPDGGKSFLPFSAGRRVCVGESLAKAELLLILSRLLQQFTFESVPGSAPPELDAEVGITRFPKPFLFCAKPRKS